jgi:putative ABC transport system permease protein
MYWQIVKLALEQIRSHKMRSGLTILGVVIGIMTVVAIAAIISGLDTSFSRQVSSLGSNIVTVQRIPQFAFRFPTEEERQRKNFTLDDAAALRDEVRNADTVTTLVPLDFTRFPDPNVRYGNVHTHGVRILGVDQDYITVYTSHMREGRFISDGDVLHRSQVVALGATIAENMFPHQDPVGKTIYFENDEFTVVGVVERRGMLFGFDRDTFLWLPNTTMLKLHPESKDDAWIALRARNPQVIPQAMDEATEILRRRRHDAAGKANSFDIGTQNQFIELYNQLTGGAYLLMLVISSIGLMVGGIGVMAIMLVSVTERTREIGVRKAIGARRRDILLQFVLEAMVLTGVGGVLGILGGGMISTLVDWLSPLPSHVSLFWIVVAFSVSVSVGLFFGIYPAARASALDPIEALRYE